MINIGKCCYFEFQQQGDNALVLNLEIYTPSYASYFEHFSEVQLLAFLDSAVLQVRSPLPDQPEKSELFGAGVGLRMTQGKEFEIVCDVASALKSAEQVDKGDIKAHVSIVYSF